MSKVWIASEYYYPDSTSTGYYLTKIAEALAQDNLVEVVCATPLFGNSGESIRADERNGVRISRIGIYDYDKNRLFSRILKFIILSFRFLILLIAKVRKGDTLIIVTNPAPLVVVSGIIKTFKRNRLIIFIHDVFPENLVATGLVKEKSISYRVVLRIFNYFYSFSDVLVGCGRDMCSLFQRKIKDYKGQIFFIPNWSDPENIYPSSKDAKEIFDRFDLEGALVFQFAGNLGRAQGIKYMLDAMQTLEGEKIKLMFFGSGVYENEIILQAERPNGNVIYGGSFHRNESIKYLNACDVAIVSLEPGMTGLGVPSKTYNILAAGKPILYIGDELSEIGQLVIESEIGVVCRPGDSASIANSINFFNNLKAEEFEQMGKRARALAEGEYRMERVLEQYRLLIQKRRTVDI